MESPDGERDGVTGRRVDIVKATNLLTRGVSTLMFFQELEDFRVIFGEKERVESLAIRFSKSF